MAKDSADIINLTNFAATDSQKEDGVRDVDDKSIVSGLLLFTDIPSPEEIKDRADKLADIAKDSGADKAMIGGAPYLMGALETALKERDITPVYSFSERVSVEKQNPDGSVTKQNVFEHKGFIEAGDSKTNTNIEKTSGENNGVLNLTQHNATDSQKKDGVTEPSNKGEIKDLLTFRGMTDKNEISERANAIADKALESGCTKAMIGGAPYLMGPLEKALESRGITPLYSFSERKVETKENPETGKMEKTTTFEHKGFVEPPSQNSDDKDNTDNDNDDFENDINDFEDDDDDFWDSGWDSVE